MSTQFLTSWIHFAWLIAGVIAEVPEVIKLSIQFSIREEFLICDKMT
uniref:Uncharacterized protein n=1 Tax=Anguilla anguilla TaxID=7936 RepID=A0A0E9XY78_ANGAN